MNLVRPVVALMLACAASTAAMAAEPEPVFSILRDGDQVVYHGGEAPLQPGTGWLALDAAGGFWRLLPATLRGEQAFNGIDDDSAGPHTGVRLHADPAAALVYLRLPGLVAGKVDTPDSRFKDHPRRMDDATALPLAFKGRSWRLDVRHHELFLTEGATSMSFGPVDSSDGTDTRTLLWAGDLDRDGRLDFIFEANGSSSGETCVWLSGLAKPGEPVGRAACWHTIGC